MMNSSFLRWVTLFSFLLSHAPIDLIAGMDAPASGFAGSRPWSLFSVPAEIGSVRDSWESSAGDARRYVLHIQDLHADYFAQKNIAAILKRFCLFVKAHDPASFQGGLLVAMEGSQGPVDAGLFSSFPHDGVREDTADYFLRRARFSGPEFFSILHSTWPVELYGIEDRDLYLEHKRIYNTCLSEALNWENWFVRASARLEDLKQAVLSAEAREFLEIKRSYEEGKVPVDGYARVLTQKARRHEVDLSALPSIRLLVEVSSLEAALDAAQVERERNAFTENLTRSLTKEELAAFVKKGLEYRLGKIREADYFDFLAGQARSPDQTRYPQLFQYMELVRRHSQFNPGRFSDEIRTLHRLLSDRILRTPDERKVLDLSEALTLLGKLIKLQVNREDLAGLRASMRSYERVLNEYGLEMPGRLNPFESFYRLAEARDLAIYENTLRRMKQSGRSVAVLLTGGFHTGGLTHLFRRRGISYSVLTPNTRGELELTEELYHRRMTGKRDALEDFLAAQPGTLHPGSLLAPLTADPALAAEMARVLRESFGLTAFSRAIAGGADLGALLEAWRRAGAEKYPELEDMEFFEQDIIEGRDRVVLARQGDRILAFRFSPDAAAASPGLLESGWIGKHFVQIMDAARMDVSSFPQEARSFVSAGAGRVAVEEIITPEMLEEMARKAEKTHPDIARSLRGLAREVRYIRVLGRMYRNRQKKMDVYKAVDQNGTELDLRWPWVRLEKAVQMAVRITPRKLREWARKIEKRHPALARRYRGLAREVEYIDIEGIRSVDEEEGVVIYRARDQNGTELDFTWPRSTLEVVSRAAGEGGAVKIPGSGVSSVVYRLEPEALEILRQRLPASEFEQLPLVSMKSLGRARRNDLAHWADGRILVREDLWTRIEEDPGAQRILRRHEFVENVLIPRLVGEGSLAFEILDHAHAVASALDAALEGTPVHSLMGHIIPLMSREDLQAIKAGHPNDPDGNFYAAAQSELQVRSLRRQAEAVSESVPVSAGERKANLHLNRRLLGAHADAAAVALAVERIKDIVSRNLEGQTDERSVTISLEEPLKRHPRDDDPITHLQIKGALFDASRPLVHHAGSGRSDNIEFTPGGHFSRRLDIGKPEGGAWLDESLREFLNTIMLSTRRDYQRSLVGVSKSKYAVGWGEFGGSTLAGRRLGFIVLGLSESTASPRGLERFDAAFFKQYGSTLRKFHDAGLIHTSLHPANVSISEKYLPVIHDLADIVHRADLNPVQDLGCLYYELHYVLNKILYLFVDDDRPQRIDDAVGAANAFVRGYLDDPAFEMPVEELAAFFKILTELDNGRSIASVDSDNPLFARIKSGIAGRYAGAISKNKIVFTSRNQIGKRDLEALEKALTMPVNSVHDPGVPMIVESIRSVFGLIVNPGDIERIHVRLFSDEGKNKRVYQVDVEGNLGLAAGRPVSLLVKVFREPPDELSARREVTDEDRERARKAAFPLQAAGMHPGMGPDVSVRLETGEVVPVFSEGRVEGPTLDELRRRLATEFKTGRLAPDDYEERLEALDRSAVAAVLKMWLILNGRYITDPTPVNLIVNGSHEAGYRVSFIDLDRVTPQPKSLASLLESLRWRYGYRDGKPRWLMLDALVDVFGHDEAVRRMKEMLAVEIPNLASGESDTGGSWTRAGMEPYEELAQMIGGYLSEKIGSYKQFPAPAAPSSRVAPLPAVSLARPEEEAVSPDILRKMIEIARRLEEAYRSEFESVERGGLKGGGIVSGAPEPSLTVDEAESMERDSGIGHRKTGAVLGEYRPYRRRVAVQGAATRLGVREAYGETLRKVQEILEKKTSGVVLRIGGRRGTGKTTFANAIGKWGFGPILPSEISVIHADRAGRLDVVRAGIEEEKKAGRKLIIVEGTYSLKERTGLFDPDAATLETDLDIFMEAHDDIRIQRLYERQLKKDAAWVRKRSRSIKTPAKALDAAGKYLTGELQRKVLTELDREVLAKPEQKARHLAKAKADLVKGLKIFREQRTRRMFDLARVQNFLDRYTIDQERAKAGVIVKNDTLKADFGIFSENSDLLLTSMLEELAGIAADERSTPRAAELLTSLLRNFSDNLVVLNIEDVIQSHTGVTSRLSRAGEEVLRETLLEFLSKENAAKALLPLLKEWSGSITTKKAMGEEDLAVEEQDELRNLIAVSPYETAGPERLDELGVAGVIRDRAVPVENTELHDDIARALSGGGAITLSKAFALGNETFDKARVEVRVVDLGEETGFRLSQRTRPVYEWTETIAGDGFVTFRVHVSKAFVQTYRTQPAVVTQALVHPLVEKIGDRKHIEAVQHEAYYQADPGERADAQTGRGVVSDLSRAILAEAAKELDWAYIRRMASVWRLDREKYPRLDIRIRGRANEIYPQVMAAAWKHLLSDDALIEAVLSGTSKRTDLFYFLQSLARRHPREMKENWIHALLANPHLEPGWVEELFETETTLREQDRFKMLRLYQSRLVEELQQQGIRVALPDEELGRKNHVALLSSLTRFPDWLQRVHPQIASKKDATGRFTVANWLRKLSMNSKALAKRFAERAVHIASFNVVHFLGYDFLNRLSHWRETTRSFMTDADRAIPLVPEAVFIYILLFPILILPAFLVRKVRDFRAAIGAYYTALGALYTAFLLFPARMPRPQVDADASWAHAILNWYYTMDYPYNTTPSNHATLSFLTGLIVLRTSTHPGRFVIFAIAAMVGISTVLVKQHFLVDVATGWLVAYLSYKLWFDWLKSFLEKRFKWFRVPEVEAYPPVISFLRRRSGSGDASTGLDVVVDPRKYKGKMAAIEQGRVIVHAGAARGKEEKFFEAIYNAVLEKTSRHSGVEEEDVRLNDRLRALTGRDLFTVDDSLLAVLGGEDRLKTWFGGANLPYSFSRFKETLNSGRVHLVLTPAVMGEHAAYRVPEAVLNEMGDHLLDPGDVVLDYGRLDYFLTRAALSKDASDRDALYHRAFAMVLEGVHRLSESGPVPETIQETAVIPGENVLNLDNLRTVASIVRRQGDGEVRWNIEKGSVEFIREGKTTRTFQAGALIRDPRRHAALQRAWAGRGVRTIRWSSREGNETVLHELINFLHGPPELLPTELESKTIRDPLGRFLVMRASQGRSIIIERLSLENLPPQTRPSPAPNPVAFPAVESAA